MKIGSKFAIIIIPLIIAPLVLAGLAASLAARNGITQVTTDFLTFKAEQLRSYAETQWNILIDNELAANPDFRSATHLAVESFARSLVRRDTELIFAVEDTGSVAMRSQEFVLSDVESLYIQNLINTGQSGRQNIVIDGEARVAHIEEFTPFGWKIFVTEKRDTFYRAINAIYWQTAIIMLITLAVTLTCLFFFIRFMTRPLQQVVGAMREVRTSNDFSTKVDILYKDEIGELGHTFNLMTGELESAYTQMKSYAFQAVLAQRKEQKIRNIFQKYVPRDVIDQFFVNPEAMLVGDSRVLAVLFSDIRSFTTISESLLPGQIVESLNSYFGTMVDVIMSRNGIVDKFIGDAIMAFFGAPVRHEDDALQAALSALDMLEALEGFNRVQEEVGRPRFNIGIGINYGVVTVGNIGSEKKMDYTVIGDMVNVASRLEELTKVYKQPLLFSESIFRKVDGTFPCRLIDTVAVRGRMEGVRIYTARSALREGEKKGWDLHERGMEAYYKREFPKAVNLFNMALDHLDKDTVLEILIDRCTQYAKYPPEDDWNGVILFSE